MDEIKLEATAILGGADITIAGNRIIERDDLAMVSVATPLGGDAALKQALKAGHGLAMPSATCSTISTVSYTHLTLPTKA